MMTVGRVLKTRSRAGSETSALYTVLLAMIAVGALLSPSFRTLQNVTNVLNQMVAIGFVALGQTFPVLTTGIDLSVGSLVSMTTAIAATVMIAGGWSVPLGLLLCLAAGCLVGLANGILITAVGIPPLIATLGTMGLVKGLTLIILPYPGGYVPSQFTRIILTNVGGVVPLGFVYLVASTLLLALFLRNGRTGRRIYAVGGHEVKAQIAGINVNLIKIQTYLLSSGFATLGGLAIAARIRSGDPLVGDPITLNSIAAVLVGGTTFAGGRGGVIGTIAGVGILSVLRVMLNMFNVSPFYQDVLSGLIVVIAVLYSSLKR